MRGRLLLPLSAWGSSTPKGEELPGNSCCNNAGYSGREGSMKRRHEEAVCGIM